MSFQSPTQQYQLHKQLQQLSIQQQQQQQQQQQGSNHASPTTTFHDTYQNEGVPHELDLNLTIFPHVLFLVSVPKSHLWNNMAALSHILFLASLAAETVETVPHPAHTHTPSVDLPHGHKRFIHLTETCDEISLILDASTLKQFQALCDFNTPLKFSPDTWYALQVSEGEMQSFEVSTGLVTTLSHILSQAKFSIFYISTAQTDYVLIKSQQLAAALTTLDSYFGHNIRMEFEEDDTTTPASIGADAASSSSSSSSSSSTLIDTSDMAAVQKYLQEKAQQQQKQQQQQQQQQQQIPARVNVKSLRDLYLTATLPSVATLKIVSQTNPISNSHSSTQASNVNSNQNNNTSQTNNAGTTSLQLYNWPLSLRLMSFTPSTLSSHLLGVIRALFFPSLSTALKGRFFSFTSVSDQISIVADELATLAIFLPHLNYPVVSDAHAIAQAFAQLPITATSYINSDTWSLVQVMGEFGFDELGIVYSLSEPLTANRICPFYVSTFKTDYVLVQAHKWKDAYSLLQHKHSFLTSDQWNAQRTEKEQAIKEQANNHHKMTQLPVAVPIAHKQQPMTVSHPHVTPHGPTSSSVSAYGMMTGSVVDDSLTQFTGQTPGANNPYGALVSSDPVSPGSNAHTTPHHTNPYGALSASNSNSYQTSPTSPYGALHTPANAAVISTSGHPSSSPYGALLDQASSTSTGTTTTVSAYGALPGDDSHFPTFSAHSTKTSSPAHAVPNPYGQMSGDVTHIHTAHQSHSTQSQHTLGNYQPLSGGPSTPSHPPANPRSSSQPQAVTAYGSMASHHETATPSAYSSMHTSTSSQYETRYQTIASPVSSTPYGALHSSHVPSQPQQQQQSSQYSLLPPHTPGLAKSHSSPSATQNSSASVISSNNKLSVIESLACYRGGIDRSTALSLLQPHAEGTYLLRQCHDQAELLANGHINPDLFVLCYLQHGKLCNTKIYRHWFTDKVNGGLSQARSLSQATSASTNAPHRLYPDLASLTSTLISPNAKPLP